MSPTLLTHRALAVILAAALIMPAPALALRAQELVERPGGAQELATGMEETRRVFLYGGVAAAATVLVFGTSRIAAFLLRPEPIPWPTTAAPRPVMLLMRPAPGTTVQESWDRVAKATVFQGRATTTPAELRLEIPIPSTASEPLVGAPLGLSVSVAYSAGIHELEIGNRQVIGDGRLRSARLWIPLPRDGETLFDAHGQRVAWFDRMDAFGRPMLRVRLTPEPGQDGRFRIAFKAPTWISRTAAGRPAGLEETRDARSVLLEQARFHRLSLVDASREPGLAVPPMLAQLQQADAIFTDGLLIALINRQAPGLTLLHDPARAGDTPWRLEIPEMLHLASQRSGRSRYLYITIPGLAPTQTFYVEDTLIKLQSLAGAVAAYLGAWQASQRAGRMSTVDAQAELQTARQAMTAALKTSGATADQAIIRFHELAPEADIPAQADAAAAIRAAFGQPENPAPSVTRTVSPFGVVEEMDLSDAVVAATARLNWRSAGLEASRVETESVGAITRVSTVVDSSAVTSNGNPQWIAPDWHAKVTAHLAQFMRRVQAADAQVFPQRDMLSHLSGILERDITEALTSDHAQPRVLGAIDDGRRQVEMLFSQYSPPWWMRFWSEPLPWQSLGQELLSYLDAARHAAATGLEEETPESVAKAMLLGRFTGQQLRQLPGDEDESLFAVMEAVQAELQRLKTRVGRDERGAPEDLQLALWQLGKVVRETDPASIPDDFREAWLLLPWDRFRQELWQDPVIQTADAAVWDGEPFGLLLRRHEEWRRQFEQDSDNVAQALAIASIVNRVADDPLVRIEEWLRARDVVWLTAARWDPFFDSEYPDVLLSLLRSGTIGVVGVVVEPHLRNTIEQFLSADASDSASLAHLGEQRLPQEQLWQAIRTERARGRLEVVLIDDHGANAAALASNWGLSSSADPMAQDLTEMRTQLRQLLSRPESVLILAPFPAFAKLAEPQIIGARRESQRPVHHVALFGKEIPHTIYNTTFPTLLDLAAQFFGRRAAAFEVNQVPRLAEAVLFRLGINDLPVTEYRFGQLTDWIIYLRRHDGGRGPDDRVRTPAPELGAPISAPRVPLMVHTGMEEQVTAGINRDVVRQRTVEAQNAEQPIVVMIEHDLLSLSANSQEILRALGQIQEGLRDVLGYLYVILPYNLPEATEWERRGVQVLYISRDGEPSSTKRWAITLTGNGQISSRSALWLITRGLSYPDQVLRVDFQEFSDVDQMFLGDVRAILKRYL